MTIKFIARESVLLRLYTSLVQLNSNSFNSQSMLFYAFNAIYQMWYYYLLQEFYTRTVSEDCLGDYF